MQFRKLVHKYLNFLNKVFKIDTMYICPLFHEALEFLYSNNQSISENQKSMENCCGTKICYKHENVFFKRMIYVSGIIMMKINQNNSHVFQMKCG